MRKMCFEIDSISKMLPHKYPFLFIDKCYDVVPGKSGRGIKFFTNNEWFFQGHFPGRPIVPGVIIIEAMAQTTAIVYLAAYLERIGVDFVNDQLSITNEVANRVGYLVRADVKFLVPVVPPSTLEIFVEIQRKFGDLSRVMVIGEVSGKIVVKGFLDVSERRL